MTRSRAKKGRRKDDKKTKSGLLQNEKEEEGQEKLRKTPLSSSAMGQRNEGEWEDKAFGGQDMKTTSIFSNSQIFNIHISKYWAIKAWLVAVN